MLKIPTFQNQSSDFTQRVTLDELEISLRFAWNTKSEYWMLNEYKEIESGKIFNGSKVVYNYPLLYQFPTSLSGQLIVLLQDSSLGTAITYSSFGAGHNLFYISEEEFESWKVTNGFQ
jgi:hypothetical protein